MDPVEIVRWIVVPVLIGLIAATPGILALKRQGNVADATAVKLLTDAASKLVQQYEQRMTEMEEDGKELLETVGEHEKEIAELKVQLNEQLERLAVREAYIEHLLRGIERLTSQLLSHELTPVWGPDQWNSQS